MTVPVNGITLAFDAVGPPGGPPVMLIHGHPFNRRMWEPQARALAAAGYRAITPDLRGYGDSEVVPGTTMLSDFAADTAAILDHLDLGRAVIVGLSMGGQIAMEFLRQYPRRVNALILADTSPVPDDEAGRAFRRTLADRLIAEGMDGYATDVIDKMIRPEHVTGMPEVAELVLDMMRTTAPQGAAAALRGRAVRPDYRQTLATAGVPTMIVVGVDDPYTPVAEATMMHQLVGGSELVVIDGAGHLPNLERPAQFNDALLRFLGTL
ncbi:alpha/beta hydrolase [Plantactinospora sp. S1510]|uniref:Alpha/beta hydrolase n=2 Tax=Plantactinospora alkalitolerans TaxID=2789879 RepID=A0ABS0GQ29_9ACTN|nr:alpha/beta hydrolase [Plantactinospora alkalitolerans]